MRKRRKHGQVNRENRGTEIGTDEENNKKRRKRNRLPKMRRSGRRKSKVVMIK